MHGPGDPENPFVKHWGSGPRYSLPIRINDQMRPMFKTRWGKRLWTKLRNEALAMWDLPFVIEPKAIDGDPRQPADGSPLINAITLYDSPDCFDCGTYRFTWSSYATGSASIEKRVRWWGLNYPQARAVTAHEIGHALGFWHGGSGIMAGGWNMTDEDRRLARRYYSGG